MSAPKGDAWPLKRIDEAADVNPPRVPVETDDETLVDFVPMAAVAEELGGITLTESRTARSVRSGYTQFAEGDVLFAKITPCMENGKIAVVPTLQGKVGFGSTEFHVLRPRPGIQSKWLAYFLSQSGFRRVAERHMAGSAGQRRVPKRWLQEQQMPIPDAEVQSEGVAKLDALFSDLDAGVAALARAKANLVRYRAAVLKAAVEGRIVPRLGGANQRACDTEWADVVRAVETPPRPNRFKSRSKAVIPGHMSLAVGSPGHKLPEGWVWVALADLAQLETGHTPSRRHPEWWGGDVPWIGIPDARANHGGTIHETLQFTNEAGLENSAARLLPAGTVCLTRTASVGYVVIMGKPMATSQDFVNWICTDVVEPRWLRLVLMADRTALKRFGKGTTHTTIYFPEVMSLHIALPPLEEQRRIVAEADRLLSLGTQAAAAATGAAERSTSLRRALLAAAFAGELGPASGSGELE